MNKVEDLSKINIPSFQQLNDENIEQITKENNLISFGLYNIFYNDLKLEYEQIKIQKRNNNIDLRYYYLKECSNFIRVLNYRQENDKVELEKEEILNIVNILKVIIFQSINENVSKEALYGLLIAYDKKLETDKIEEVTMSSIYNLISTKYVFKSTLYLLDFINIWYSSKQDSFSLIRLFYIISISKKNGFNIYQCQEIIDKVTEIEKEKEIIKDETYPKELSQTILKIIKEK